LGSEPNRICKRYYDNQSRHARQYPEFHLSPLFPEFGQSLPANFAFCRLPTATQKPHSPVD
jgi:hypothetical protein